MVSRVPEEKDFVGMGVIINQTPLEKDLIDDLLDRPGTQEGAATEKTAEKRGIHEALNQFSNELIR